MARKLCNIGKENAAHWRERLSNLGVGEDAVRNQVLSFQTEVQVEMMRRYSDRLAAEAQDGYTLNS